MTVTPGELEAYTFGGSLVLAGEAGPAETFVVTGGPLVLNDAPSSFVVGGPTTLGPRGLSDSVRQTFTAAMDLSGHRVVTVGRSGGLVYARNDYAGHMQRPLWLTVGATMAGEVGEVVLVGTLTEPSWSWVPRGVLYLGANGFLTQTPPTDPEAAFTRIVGTALTATTILFNPLSPIAYSEPTDAAYGSYAEGYGGQAENAYAAGYAVGYAGTPAGYSAGYADLY